MITEEYELTLSVCYTGVGCGSVGCGFGLILASVIFS